MSNLWLESEERQLIEARLATPNHVTDALLAERLWLRMGRTKDSVYLRLRKLAEEIEAQRNAQAEQESIPRARGRGGYVAHPNQRKRRPCMCCGTEFISEGAHNRLCCRCRSLDISPFAPGGA